MEIRHMGPIGALITGVDVKTMDDATFAKIYQTWLDCNVICVRGQQLELADFLAYSRRFGTVSPHPSKVTRHPDCPEVTLLGANKFRPDGTLDRNIYKRGAEGFHTDGSYEEVPFKATQLYAIAIPLAFVNQWISDAIYVAVATIWLVPDPRIEGRIRS